MIYVPNFATKCCHNFALCEIKPVDIFALTFNKAEFINRVCSIETRNIEEQYDEDSNSRKEQGNTFTAIFRTLGSARIKTQGRSYSREENIEKSVNISSFRKPVLRVADFRLFLLQEAMWTKLGTSYN